MSVRRRAERIVLDGRLTVIDHWPEVVHAVVDFQTTPGSYHAVHWRPDGWECDCRGHHYRGICTHIVAVQVELRRQGLSARNTTRRTLCHGN